MGAGSITESNGAVDMSAAEIDVDYIEEEGES